MSYNAKIEIYNLADTLVYTITDPLEVHVKDILTSGVSTFNFTVSALKGFLNNYDAIGHFYRVKIYIGQGTLTSSDLILNGRALKQTTTYAPPPSGCLRKIEGEGMGEVLKRRFKINKRWYGEPAENIPIEAANDLDLGYSIVNDTTNVTLGVYSENYFELMQRISDYWVNAGLQLKKDFYVDNGDVPEPNGYLYWKPRPLRTEGVESLIAGINVANYTVVSDVLPVRNNITVKGAANSYFPSDRDQWTENDSTGWTCVIGTLQHNAGGGILGTYCVQLNTEGSEPTIGKANITHELVNLRDITTLKFWHYNAAAPDVVAVVRILAPSSISAYFQADINNGGSTATMESFELGQNNTFDASLNPTGQWVQYGNANWEAMQGIEFEFRANIIPITAYKIDALHYLPYRHSYLATDPTSINNFGQRDAEYINDNLLSDSEVESHGEALLYQQQNPTIRIDATLTRFNSNVKKGDRCPVTLPMDNISAIDFDVVSVEHAFVKDIGAGTSATLIYSGDTRKLPPRTLNESLVASVADLKRVAGRKTSWVMR